MTTTTTGAPAVGDQHAAPDSRLVRWLGQRRDRARAAVIRLLLALPRHRALVATLTGACWAIVSLVRMLWPVPVGLGDAGDGERLLCQIGATPPVESMGASTGYLPLTWSAHGYYGETCGVPTTGETYWSSQLILLRISTWLGGLLGLPGGIDFRVLSVLCSLLVGLGVGLMVLALPASLSMPKRVLVAGVAGLLMVDSGIARFYASPYSEPAALLGVFLLCPALLWLLGQRRFTWGALVAVAGVGAFTVLAKTQMISLLPPLVAVLLLRPSLPSRWHAGVGRRARRGPVRRSRLLHWIWLRTPALLLAGAVSAACLGTMAHQPKRYAEITSYDQVFGTILPNSPDPDSDLRWFGLDPSLARASGTNIYSPNTAAYDPAYQGHFVESVSEGRIALFYLSQPGRLIKLGDVGMRGMAGYDTETYMANYPAGSGMPPYAKESRIAVFAGLSSVYRAAPWLFGVQWLLLVVVFIMVARRWRRARHRQSIGVLGLFLLTGLSIQFWAVLMSDGENELMKHLVVVDLMMFLSLIMLLAVGLQRKPNTVVVTRQE
jgi:hypothetical protein